MSTECTAEKEMITHSEGDSDSLRNLWELVARARPRKECAVLRWKGCSLQKPRWDEYQCQDILKTPGYAPPDCGNRPSTRRPRGLQSERGVPRTGSAPPQQQQWGGGAPPEGGLGRGAPSTPAQRVTRETKPPPSSSPLTSTLCSSIAPFSRWVPRRPAEPEIWPIRRQPEVARSNCPREPPGARLRGLRRPSHLRAP